MNDSMHDRNRTFASRQVQISGRARRSSAGGGSFPPTSIRSKTLPSSANLPRPDRTPGALAEFRVRLERTVERRSCRIEEGGRTGRPVLSRSRLKQSDIGVSGWNGRCSTGPMTTYARVARRQNIDKAGATEATYTPDEV